MPRPTADELWELMLTGNLPRLQRMRQVWGLLPSPPRCKLCNAPFRGPGGVLMRTLAYGPSGLNRRLCKWCVRAVHRHPGGAELEISVLFADVRGSTAIAERMAPEAFSRLLARFYGVAADVIDDHDGIVDKFVGDGAIALFIPGFAGSDHAAEAIATARSLLERTRDGDGDVSLPLGAGVHTGRSFVGALGDGDARDFTAVGDTVNIAARLADVAGAGEILISAEAAAAAGLATAGLERRSLDVRGRGERVDAWVGTS